jgi:hypothetical protein
MSRILLAACCAGARRDFILKVVSIETITVAPLESSG